MSDSINSISPNLRDYLLGLNLMPDNSLLSEMHGIGHTAGIYDSGLFQGEDLDDISEGYREVRLNNNEYTDLSTSNETVSLYSSPIGGSGDPQIPYNRVNTTENELTIKSNKFREVDTLKNYYVPDKFETRDIGRIIPGTFNKQVNGYLDENQNLNSGGPSTDVINVIGGFIQGDVGINPDGSLASGYDVRASIIGRGLTSVGVIEDTALGNIGATELARAMSNNAAFGLQQETIDRINTNSLDLLTGGKLLAPNYDITVPKNTLGKVANFFSRVAGVESPISLMSAGSFEYSPKSICKGYIQSNQFASNLQTNNNFINNSGKGQINALFFNLKQNCYKPGYEDKRVGDDGINTRYYASSKEDVIVNSSSFPGTIGAAYGGYYSDYAIGPDETNHTDVHEHQWDVDLRETGKKQITTTVPNPNFDNYDLAPEYRGPLEIDVTTTEIYEINHGLKNPYQNNQESLLFKTKELFNATRDGNASARTLITKDSDEHVEISDGLYTPYSYLKSDMSKGSGAVNKDGELCRVWSTMRRYNQVENLQKNSGVFTTPGTSEVLREGLSESVLGDNDNGNGFPKIGPYVGDSVSGNIKKFMFSIENLAWGDHNNSLPPCEIGPGDPLSGTKGRIMWFPPYGLNFTDNSSTNWETIPFIGRGEPIYTYNYTERIGTLQFQVIVDHPSVLNNLRLVDSETEINTTMVGCKKPDTKFTSSMTEDEKTQKEVNENTVPTNRIDNEDCTEGPFSFYFPNDSAEIQDKYEYDGGSSTTVPTYGLANADSSQVMATTQFNRTYFGLNKNMDSELDFISELFNDGNVKDYVIFITGFASFGQPGGTPSSYNKDLSLKRANYFKDKLMASTPILTNANFVIEAGGENGPTIADTAIYKNYELREYKEARRVTIRVEYTPENKSENNTPDTSDYSPSSDNSQPKSMVGYSECDYFTKLRQDNEFIYDDIRKQLKYFHPAFHSITPEGLNSRLTFLKQCTRQGPSDSADVDNLAFGRPPICILRIGDFYHTKIVIDNVNFSYDPLVWDLNPEGIGVQPMLVTVNMSFKFIGGSSLAGPISRLQNAVSFNFFANTEVYDKRADRIEMDGTVGKLVRGTGIKPNKKEDKSKTDQGGDTVEGGVNSNKQQPKVDQTKTVYPEKNKQETPQEPKINYNVYISISNGFDFYFDMGPNKPINHYQLEITNKDNIIIATTLPFENDSSGVYVDSLMYDRETGLTSNDFIGGYVNVKMNGVSQQKIKITNVTNYK